MALRQEDTLQIPTFLPPPENTPANENILSLSQAEFLVRYTGKVIACIEGGTDPSSSNSADQLLNEEPESNFTKYCAALQKAVRKPLQDGERDSGYSVTGFVIAPEKRQVKINFADTFGKFSNGYIVNEQGELIGCSNPKGQTIIEGYPNEDGTYHYKRFGHAYENGQVVSKYSLGELDKYDLYREVRPFDILSNNLPGHFKTVFEENPFKNPAIKEP